MAVEGNAFGFKLEPEKMEEFTAQIREEAKVFYKEYKKYKDAFFSQLEDDVRYSDT